ncbi:MAG: hypothetical protein ACFBWO_01960 [Paracoccaceae bacterium]
MRALALAAALTLMAMPAAAHRLMVFASVEGGEVLVETKFSNGKRPAAGRVIVFDADERELRRLDLGPDGTARFPAEGGEAGLRIEVRTGEGHDDYWILTPEDVAGGG